MTIARKAVDQKGMLCLKLTGAASVVDAALGAFANPEGVPLLIARSFIHFRTGSTGAANLDVGVGAVGAKASDIVSALAVLEATVGGKVVYGPAAQVAETEVPTAIWEADEYLTFSGSATTVGLDADVYVEYLRLDAS
jgi:hypothetical protein